MTFRERYQKWKAGEQVYSAGRVLQGYEDGKDKRPSYYRRAEDLIAKGGGFRSGVYQNEGDIHTAGYGFTAKQDLLMPNIDQVVYPNQEYISKYAGDPVRPSFEQTMQDRKNIWNLLNTPQYIINPPQFVPQFELNTQLEQPWTVQ